MFLKFLVTKEHRKLKPAVSSQLFLFVRYQCTKLLSLKKRKKSARFHCAAVNISKMTSRSCEERNCFKGLSLFFLKTTTNIALTFPTKILSWLVVLKEAENFLLKFATDLFPRLTSRISLFNVNVLNHN